MWTSQQRECYILRMYTRNFNNFVSRKTEPEAWTREARNLINYIVGGRRAVVPAGYRLAASLSAGERERSTRGACPKQKGRPPRPTCHFCNVALTTTGYPTNLHGSCIAAIHDECTTLCGQYISMLVTALVNNTSTGVRSPQQHVS